MNKKGKARSHGKTKSKPKFIEEVLKINGFQKSRCRAMGVIIRKEVITEIPRNVLTLVSTIVLYYGASRIALIPPAPLHVTLIVPSVVLISVLILLLPSGKFLSNNLWIHVEGNEKNGVGQPSKSELRKSPVAYVRRKWSEDALYVTAFKPPRIFRDLLGSLKGCRKLSEWLEAVRLWRKPSTEIGPSQKHYDTLIQNLGIGIKSLDYHVSVLNDHPTSSGWSRGVNFKTEVHSHIRRPTVFFLVPAVSTILIALSVAGLIGSTSQLFSGQDSLQTVDDWRVIGYLMLVWVAILCIGIFSVTTYLWERKAWVRFSTSEQNNLSYYDATKELREYSVTVIFGLISTAFVLTSLSLGISIAPTSMQEDLSFPVVGKILLGLFVLLTLNSAGKVMGAGRSSLDKAFVGASV